MIPTIIFNNPLLRYGALREDERANVCIASYCAAFVQILLDFAIIRKLLKLLASDFFFFNFSTQCI